MARDKRVREKYYDKLCKRDGECCNICKKSPPNVYLEVDHIDGNKNNNPVDMSNFQLLCSSDNRKKNPRGKGKQKRKKVISTTGVINDKQMSHELRLSKQYQPAFRHWLYNEMKQRGKMTAKEVIFEGAERINCSPFTIRTAYLPDAI
jgi:5-methylcytosine-specific restriction endonuclease McrA